MTDKERVVVVPVLVSAFANYANRVYKTFGTTPAAERAYLAPITPGDPSGATLHSDFIKHDIFDDLRSPPYGSDGDIYRQTDSRSGLYIHWSLPKVYRSGVVASQTGGDELLKAKQRGGYPLNDDQSPDDGTPTYRPVPTRWIVVRRLTSLDGKPLKLIRSNPDGSSNIETWTGPRGVPEPVARDVFVVLSDCIRRPGDMDPTEDVEVMCSPLIDLSLGEGYLGKSTLLRNWSGETDVDAADYINLTIARTSNPFFADYQPQNAGVFSFFDNLRPEGSTGQFQNVRASYSVFGYHPDVNSTTTDPLAQSLAADQTRQDRLTACFMQPPDSSNADDTAWLGGTNGSNMRTLCRGRILDCVFYPQLSENIPMTNPADDIQTSFSTSHPVSIGTNAMDALYAWLDAQKTDLTGNDELDKIEAQLLRLQSLVLDNNDDIDSHLQAQDLLATNSFIPSAHGVVWHFAPSDSKTQSAVPTPTAHDMATMNQMNEVQAYLNALSRQRKHLNSLLFGQWWTYVSGRTKPGSALQKSCTKEVTRLKGLISKNIVAVASLNKLLKTYTTTIPTKTATEPAFYIQRDPTIMVAGSRNGWPAKGDAQIALDSQAGVGGPPAVMRYEFAGKIPRPLVNPLLRCEIDDVLSEDPNYKPPYPLQLGGQSDRFNATNGWFPLFIEWEVEYYHIPFEYWEFAPQGPEARYGYRIKESCPPLSGLPHITKDYRVISGRSLVVPQVAEALKTTLKQVIAKMTPEELQDCFPNAGDQDTLLASVEALDHLSTSMSGFTTQLVTMMQGTHVTPLNYSDPKNPKTLDSATKINLEIGLDADTLHLMQSDMDLTPFANLVSIPADSTQFSPFKPCTHGQFRFTKLNIVDKFGQVVQGIKKITDMRVSEAVSHSSLFPCLGDSYSLRSVDNKGLIADAVMQRPDSLCSFVQLPPSVNQNARVNAAFVVPDTASYNTFNNLNIWRPVDDWENPILGWLVINYANYSIQTFAADGEFVREYSIANSKPVTRPFPVDVSLYASQNPAFTALLQEFDNPAYLEGMFNSITRAIEFTETSPSQYSQSMLSMLGKPLALVQFGVSLQLADLPFKNQSKVHAENEEKAKYQSVLDYQFDIKIGEKDNIFDGMYGWFSPEKGLPQGSKDAFDYSKFYTYHGPDSLEKPRAPAPGDPSLAAPTSVKLRPFFTDPALLADRANAYSASQQAHEYRGQVNSHMRIFTALINPYSAIHLYSALLPIKQLTLPPLAISDSLSQIRSFFKMGPLILPTVPETTPANFVTQDYRIDDPAAPVPAGATPIPAVGLGDWSWLQPAYVTGQDTATTEMHVSAVGPVSTAPQWDPAPYVAVEGYLQMLKPFTQPTPPAPPAPPAPTLQS